jgi:hypothetical protein
MNDVTGIMSLKDFLRYTIHVTSLMLDVTLIMSLKCFWESHISCDVIDALRHRYYVT